MALTCFLAQKYNGISTCDSHVTKREKDCERKALVLCLCSP